MDSKRVETRIALHHTSSDPVKVGKSNVRHTVMVVADRRGVEDCGGPKHGYTLFWSECSESDFENKQAAINAVYADATEWADQHYPDWRDPAAYWDKDILGEGKPLEQRDGYWFLDGRKVETGDAMEVRLIDPPKWVRIRVAENRDCAPNPRWGPLWIWWPAGGLGLFSCVPVPVAQSDQPLFRWPADGPAKIVVEHPEGVTMGPVEIDGGVVVTCVDPGTGPVEEES